MPSIMSLQEPRGRGVKLALFSGNYNYTADGANRALNRLVGHLQREEDAQVRVYSPTSARPAFPPEGALVSVPSLPLPGRGDYRMATGLSGALKRDLDQFAPELVHLSAPDLLGLSALRFAQRRGIPVVSSLHTLFETYLDYYALGWLRPAAEHYLLNFYRSCDFVLAPNQAIANELSAAGVGDRVRIWSRGVDHSLFNPARRDLGWRRSLGVADDATVVAFFGRIVMEKGLDAFVAATDIVRRERPDCRILVIGDGPARPWLARRVPDALFTGFLTGPELGRAVASADILLNPSRTESFCNVSLEAMASGLAAVCSDAPNHVALIRPGATGLLRPGENPAAFAAAVLDLVADPGRRLRLGAAARQASLLYSWPTILAGVADVYREAIGGAAEFDAAA